MARKMNQPKTIIKWIIGNLSWPSEAQTRSTWSDERINADLADFAEQMWHNQYVEVDYSKVTPDMFRKAAAKKVDELKVFWAGEPEEFM